MSNQWMSRWVARGDEGYGSTVSDVFQASDTLPAMVDRNVLVCGAGLMGHGIAQVMAAAGNHLSIYEPEVARAEAGRARIGANLERSVAKGRISEEQRHEQLGRIAVATSLADAARSAELVVEAVFEDEAIKRDLFSAVAATAPAHAVIARHTT